MKTCGTMVTVQQSCIYCGENSFKWMSQHLVLGRYPAGNLLLSFAVLMAGGLISKVLLVFRHMGLQAIDIRTYFSHQKKFVFPAVLHYWEICSKKLLEDVKKLSKTSKEGGEPVWCGDGRFDSVGHSAKYGAYSMFCNTTMKIAHFELVQVS